MLPEWNAIPPVVKNTALGMGVPWNSLLMWSGSFHSTVKVPTGVSIPGPPALIGTGPRITRPSRINQACMVYKSTYELVPVPFRISEGDDI
jgi:hypothetical protein